MGQHMEYGNMKYSNEERLAYAKNEIEKWKPNQIHPSAIIFDSSMRYLGGDGFGYARDTDGTLIPMPHRGNIIIEKDVVIKSFCTIDRAMVGSTIIGEGTKIDHHTHVAHGVHIGKNCLIVGAKIGGSVEIGDNCFIGHGAIIKNKVKIGNNVTIGQGANVLKDVPDGETWIGNPARRLDK